MCHSSDDRTILNRDAKVIVRSAQSFERLPERLNRTITLQHHLNVHNPKLIEDVFG